jgi:hypothetical protein
MSEEAVLNFIIKMHTEGTQAAVRNTVEAMDALAESASEANEEILGSGGETVAEKVEKGEKKKQDALWDTTELMEKSHKAIGKVQDFLKEQLRESIEAWKEHYLAVVRWRKEFAQTGPEIDRFSTAIVQSTAKYGGSMRTATEVALTLRRGALMGGKAAAEMAGQFARMESLTGVQGKTMADLTRKMSLFNDVLDETEVEKWAMDLRGATSQSIVMADEIMTSVVPAWSEISSRLEGIASKGTLKKLGEDMFLFSSGVVASGGELEMVSGLIGAIGDASSDFSKHLQENGLDLETTLRRLLMAAKGGDLGLGAETGKLYVQTAKMMGLHTAGGVKAAEASLQKMGDYQLRLLKEQGKTLEQQRSEAYNSAAAIEKVSLNLEQARNNAAGLFDVLYKTGPIAEGLAWTTEQLVLALKVARDIVDPEATPAGIAKAEATWSEFWAGLSPYESREDREYRINRAGLGPNAEAEATATRGLRRMNEIKAAEMKAQETREKANKFLEKIADKVGDKAAKDATIRRTTGG